VTVTVKRELLPKLICPSDHSELRLVPETSALDVDDGYLTCTSSESHRYPIVEGIPDFRDVNMDHVAQDEPPEYGTCVTKAVANRVRELRGDWSLDIGCGRGAYRPFLPGKYVGVDIVRPFLIGARDRYPDGTFIAADARRLPFKAGAFDIVVASQVIEHIDLHDLSPTLQAFRQVSSHTVIVDTPNETRFFRLLRRFVYGQDAAGMHNKGSPLAHHAVITTELLRQHGFKVEGCIGHVTRARFDAPYFWDAYDAVARRIPVIGGNLIGIAQSVNVPASVEQW
jgi:uncharacterized protein YbaR (Trm112 family)